jgi:hypothetical protein
MASPYDCRMTEPLPSNRVNSARTEKRAAIGVAALAILMLFGAAVATSIPSTAATKRTGKSPNGTGSPTSRSKPADQPGGPASAPTNTSPKQSNQSGNFDPGLPGLTTGTDGATAEATTGVGPLVEDFSNPADWAYYTDETSIIGLSRHDDNPMLVFSLVGEQQLLGFPVSRRPADTDVTLSATVLKKAAMTSVGAFCRRQGVNRYEFHVANTGQYAIFRVEEARYVYLVPNNRWAVSKLIPKNFSSINISASCQGPNLSLYISGKLVTTVMDSSYTDGGAGVLAEQFKGATGEFRVFFDDVTITG